jgi:hypothetical protein
MGPVWVKGLPAWPASSRTTDKPLIRSATHTGYWNRPVFFFSVLW